MKNIKRKWQKALSKADKYWGKITVSLIIALILMPIGFYVQKRVNTKTFYVAYIGKYRENTYYDKRNELALHKYIDELNKDLNGVRLILQPYNLNSYENDANKIYHKIYETKETAIVIDGSWGSDLQKARTIIYDQKIPVIHVNADKSADYNRNIVFLGHDNEVPKKVANFCKKILKKEKVIFITESDYLLTESFQGEFKNNNIEINEISVKSNQTTDIDRQNLFRYLDGKIKEFQSQSTNAPVTIALNVHQSWGNEVISRIENNKEFKNIEIVGGSYIIDGAKFKNFDQGNRGNKLFLLNSPADAISKKIYNDVNDLKMLPGVNLEIFNDIKSPLYIKRCSDAVSLIREVLLAKPNVMKAEVSRDTFINFFQNNLANNKIKIGDELYIFDDNLMLFDDRPFELRSQGEIATHNEQLNIDLIPISNVYFGIDSINVSNINVEERTFHADFFYWIKGSSANLDIDQYIQFRNERKQSVEKDVPINQDDKTSYKLFRKSADFNIDFDFEKYPFDTQEIKIEVEIIDPINKITISYDNSDIENSKKRAMNIKNLDQWTVKDFYITVDNFTATTFRGRLIDINRTPQKFTTLNVRMPISRNATIPFVTIILPLLMIGIASIAILFIKDNSFTHIGEVCVGIFLSIVTYSISFAQLTPRSNTLTFADWLFYGTFFLVLLIFLKTILVNSYLKNETLSRIVNVYPKSPGFIALICYCLFIVIIAWIKYYQ